jgi:hypothetical protein
MTKLYLVCEDIDLGYHVYGVYDNKEYAEAKMNECIEVNARMTLMERDEDIPEKLDIQECDFHHRYFINIMDLNSDKGIGSNNDWKIEFIQRSTEERKTRKALEKELNCSYACTGDIMYLHKTSFWTQDLQDKLIELYNAGTPPNIMEFAWSGQLKND